MTTTRRDERGKAFTLTELFIILAVICVMAMFLTPVFMRARQRAQRISCTNQLMQIGLAFKTWALDRTNLYPMQVSRTNGGALEFAASREVFRCFQVMSNELVTPLVLTCPADRRKPARDFASLANSNLSYFVGIDGDDEHPSMILAGDRNLTNGSPPVGGILTLTTNRPFGWTHEIHNGTGQVLLYDGSVQQLSISGLQKWSTSSQGARLAIP